jgi:hypothetical protein
LKTTKEALEKTKAQKWNNFNTLNLKNKLWEIENYLWEKGDKIKQLESGIKSGNGLDKLYIEASKIEYDIKNIDAILKSFKVLSNKK